MGAIDYLDTEKATIKMLKNWYDQNWKLERGEERIAEINRRMYSYKSISDSTPVQGGDSKMEASLCNSIDQKTAALHGIKKAKEYKKDIEECWDRLTNEERYCLLVRFVDDEPNGIGKIMEKYHISKTEAYNRSNDALSRLAGLIYWF